MRFDRKLYFDSVRASLFKGGLTQQQVDGQEIILGAWERGPGLVNDDLRHLAYCLSTTKHETASTMQPIEEYGKGEGQPYGEIDPETKQQYYGRGFVQLTWRENYARATEELELDDSNDLEWHAERALDPVIAAQVMFEGMSEGWFRSGHTLGRYFSATADDSFNAREIINGDKNYKPPSGSTAKNMGTYIANIHACFLVALQAALIEDEPEPEVATVMITITTTGKVRVMVQEED
jgi:hypothetical protein